MELLAQLCEGLHYAHTLADASGRHLGLVHRDLKPANLMLSRDGVVKIMDFGMAKATSNLRESTMTGTAKGTPAYMSPEQVRGLRDIAAASDLFAVGGILYELITGQRLFEADTAVSTMFAVVGGADPAKLAEAERIQPGIGAILERCVALDPADRWPSASELGRAIRKLRETLPEPPHAARFVAQSILQGPHRVDAEETSARSQELQLFVKQVHTLVARQRNLTMAGPTFEQTMDYTPAASSTNGALAEETVDFAPVGETVEFIEVDSVVAPTPERTGDDGETGASVTLGAAKAPPIRPSWLLLGGIAATLILGGTTAAWLRPWQPATTPSPQELSPATSTFDPPASAPPAEQPSTALVSEAHDSAPAVDSAPPPVASSRSDAASTPARVRPSSSKKPAATLAPTATIGTGSVLVKASPWGRVAVDGVPSGQTPVRLELPVGTHEVVVSCAECVEPESKSFSVQVRREELASVKAEFINSTAIRPRSSR
ncbi:MAG: hypothetical protein ACI8PZ_007539 [Myxococcota bacterium]